MSPADTLALATCLLLPPTPNERNFRNERKGGLPPLVGDDRLEDAVDTVALPLTDGYRDGDRCVRRARRHAS